MSAREDWWWKFTALTAVAAAGVTALATVRRGRSLRAELAAARHAASHDPLTGLANRAGFTAHAERVASRRAVVVLIDLDAFKPINDTLVHEVGDAVLISVAARLREALAPFGVVARLGGDEFAAILHTGFPHTDTDTWARELMLARVVGAVSAPLSVAGRAVSVGASVGAALHSGHIPVSVSLHRADTAMYRAKRGGSGRVAVYDPALDTTAIDPRPAPRLRDTTPAAARLREVAA